MKKRVFISSNHKQGDWVWDRLVPCLRAGCAEILIDRERFEVGGWPHLVQLIAETLVDLINDDDKSQVDDELFEKALNKAVVSGHNVLHELMKGESKLPGEWEYLSNFRAQDTQPSPDDETVFGSLRRRMLVMEENGAWRLRVPLMRRWLIARG